MPSEAYLAAREKIKEAKGEAQRLAKEAFEVEAIALVNEMGIRSFSWTQYTPYFNDGDACVFGVNSDAMINGADEYGDSDDEDDEETPASVPGRPTIMPWASGLSPEQKAEADAAYEAWRAPFKKIGAFLNGWEDEDMLFMFGDHVKVTVSKEGIDVENYDHD